MSGRKETGSARLRRNMVLKALRHSERPMSVQDLEAAVEIPITNEQLIGALSKLWNSGRIERTDGGYRFVQ